MTETNPFAVRKLVLKLCQCISDRHFAILPDLFKPSSTWTVLADPSRASYGGTTSATDQIARWPSLLGGFSHFSFDAGDVIVEGNKAVVDVRITGRGSSDTQNENERYDNEYLMWIVTDEKAEKILSVKQSLDCYRVEAWVESKGTVDGNEVKGDRDGRSK